MQNNLLQSLFKKQLIQNNLFHAKQLITVSFLKNNLYKTTYFIQNSLFM